MQSNSLKLKQTIDFFGFHFWFVQEIVLEAVKRSWQEQWEQWEWSRETLNEVVMVMLDSESGIYLD